MSTKALTKFAEELKNARESKKITLQQIANKTKIDQKFLQAIEDANFNILPDIYIRAFIREYAQNINLDPEETIHNFTMAKAEISENVLGEQKRDIPEIIKNEPVKKEFDSITVVKNKTNEGDKGEKNSFKINYLIGGAILIVAAILFYFAFFYESPPEIIADQQEEISKKADPRFEIGQQNKISSIPVEVSKILDDSLRVTVKTSEIVWIKVLSDGKNIYQKVVSKDSKLDFKAKEKFSISVGNAGVVKILFNDKEVPNVGNYGEVRNIILTKDLTRYYTVPRNEKKSTTTN
jgi:cytoskeleton protein RodZ